MTDRPNVRPIRNDDRRFVEGPVAFVRLSRDAKPSLFARIADALASPRMFTFYLGFYAGCAATVALALVWAKWLS